MAGYDVVIEKIRGTGRAATRVAEGLRGATCSAAVPSGDAGMPGARCVGKLAAVKQALRDREQGYERRLDTHAASMAKAADLYSSREDAATADLSVPAQSTGGRKPV
ncbi:hypothetical protein [Amycolatopsis azurea]|uniref:Uncharacterized protein n=1 Tax=Amycolatopsis azurea DSM 43854 TaxID=1238180 RepID=M2Q6V1_9PSEU|nr:hypothetical protein [Amycolatopsis azurea]EMD21837.1 hypothetical protein C791_0789 [Amycolatopsis azurea DSM 43854]OOC00927.1 hypothetical protein B0293_40730 [Amycolatopsis azurea DSM 43854]